MYDNLMFNSVDNTNNTIQEKLFTVVLYSMEAKIRIPKNSDKLKYIKTSYYAENIQCLYSYLGAQQLLADLRKHSAT